MCEVFCILDFFVFLNSLVLLLSWPRAHSDTLNSVPLECGDPGCRRAQPPSSSVYPCAAWLVGAHACSRNCRLSEQTSLLKLSVSRSSHQHRWLQTVRHSTPLSRLYYLLFKFPVSVGFLAAAPDTAEVKSPLRSWAWRCTPVIPECGRWRQGE